MSERSTRPPAVVALNDRRGDRDAFDLLVQQRLDLRGDGRDIHRPELAADRLGEDVQRRYWLEIGRRSFVGQQRLVGPRRSASGAEEAPGAARRER